ncbi:MAG: hypothetical protein QOF95_698 [Pseudonocardiales bacterium]|nr:hypothetical protein [Pseudonocardiales bacterium]
MRRRVGADCYMLGRPGRGDRSAEVGEDAEMSVSLGGAEVVCSVLIEAGHPRARHRHLVWLLRELGRAADRCTTSDVVQRYGSCPVPPLRSRSPAWR